METTNPTQMRFICFLVGVGVCAACDKDIQGACWAVTHKDLVDLADAWQENEEHYQKRCRVMETYAFCIAPALVGCDIDLIDYETKIIEQNNGPERYNCSVSLDVGKGGETVSVVIGGETVSAAITVIGSVVSLVTLATLLSLY